MLLKPSVLKVVGLILRTLVTGLLEGVRLDWCTVGRWVASATVLKLRGVRGGCGVVVGGGGVVGTCGVVVSGQVTLRQCAEGSPAGTPCLGRALPPGRLVLL